MVYGSRRHTYFTNSKRTFMEKHWVSSWWATSAQKGPTTHSVCLSLIFKFPPTVFLLVTLINLSSETLRFNRSAHRGDQQRHRGGQSAAGAPRASQAERGQLLHQHNQLTFSLSPHHRVHVTDDHQRSLTAGCGFSKHSHKPDHQDVCY